MVKDINKIPNEVLIEIFPRKLIRSRASDWVYTQLKKMILTGKLKKGKRIFREEIARNFGVTGPNVSRAFSQLKKEGLIIPKGKKGSFVA
jgi:DNA-binding GntR family transcriptional regulator